MSTETQNAMPGLTDGGATSYNLKILNSAVAPPPPPPGLGNMGGQTALHAANVAFGEGAPAPVVYQSQAAESIAVASVAPKVLLLVAGLLITGLGYVAFTGPGTPSANLVAFIKSINAFLGIDEGTRAVIKTGATNFRKASREAPVKAAPTDAELLAQFSPEMIENPYWYVPNPAPAADNEAQALGAEDEETVRAGLDETFTYRNWKAVRAWRAKRAKGSDELAAKALAHKKYWTRMEALMAQAESGGAVTVDDVEKALGDARSSLISYHMERFAARPDPAARHVLRHMVKLVDAPNRARILGLLLGEGEHEHRLYLAAATFDPSPEVKAWLAAWLPWHPLPPGVVDEFKLATVKGWRETAAEAAATQPRPAQPVPAAAVVKGIEQSGDVGAAGAKAKADGDDETVEVEEVPVQKVEFYKEKAAPTSAKDDKAAREKRKADQDNARDDGFESLGGKEFEVKKTGADGFAFPRPPGR